MLSSKFNQSSINMEWFVLFIANMGQLVKFYSLCQVNGRWLYLNLNVASTLNSQFSSVILTDECLFLVCKILMLSMSVPDVRVH
jgi:hypothetical protein